MVVGMTLVIYLASKSIPKAVIMVVFGIIMGNLGVDATSGAHRFTFGILELNDGIGLIPMVMGLFGISEVLLNVEENIKRELFTKRVKGLLPTKQDWKDSGGPIARGSVLGFLLGVLPGGGAFISSFVSYALEKRLSKHPAKFGKGAIEGVAGP